MNGPSLMVSLENYLKLSVAREQTITANMANVDTPGYRTVDIDFDREVQRAMKDGAKAESAMETTPVAHEVEGLMERPDGNNVSLDREGLSLAETQLHYAAAVQLLKHQFHNMLAAINGGN